MSVKTSKIYLTDINGDANHDFSIAGMGATHDGKLIVELVTEAAAPIVRLALSRADVYDLLRVLTQHLGNKNVI